MPLYFFSVAKSLNVHNEKHAMHIFNINVNKKFVNNFCSSEIYN